MSTLDKYNENKYEFKQDFIKYSIIHNELLISNKNKSNNARKKLVELLEMVREGYYEKDLFLELIDHDNPCVSIMAATNLLRLNFKIEEAIGKLNELKEYNNEKKLWYLKSNARMILDIYNKNGKI